MVRRLLVAAVAAGALAAPSAAQAWSIHEYRVRDAGPTVVHRLTLCSQAKPGYEQKFYFTAYTETGDGSDAGNVKQYNWFSRGCWTVRVEHDDDLKYEGRYYGRVKVRLAHTDWIKFSSWRAFWSS
jgi:hypothetical protein